MCVIGAGNGGGEAVLKRLSAKDRTLAELHMRRVDLSLRHIPMTPAAAGCIISSERGQSFRRWLYRWIRQTLERCPHGAAHLFSDAQLLSARPPRQLCLAAGRPPVRVSMIEYAVRVGCCVTVFVLTTVGT